MIKKCRYCTPKSKQSGDDYSYFCCSKCFKKMAESVDDDTARFRGRTKKDD